MYKCKKIILLLIPLFFFCFVIYPNTGLRFESKNIEDIRKENRNITPIPEGSMTKKEFYKNIEMWYQDRLALRRKCIDKWCRYQFKFFNVFRSKEFVMANDGWLLNKSNSVKCFVDPEIKINKIKKLQNYCYEHGIKFVCLIAPYKENIYREKFPDYFLKTTPDPKIFRDDFNRRCIEAGINNIDLYPDIMSAKADGKDLYFKDDHHWSYYGAAIATDKILNNIDLLLNKNQYKGIEFDGSEVEAAKEHSYASKVNIDYDTRLNIPWNSKFSNNIYILDPYNGTEVQVTEPVSNNLLWSHLVNDEAILINKDIKNDISVLVLGDSYASYIATYATQYIHQWVQVHWDKKYNAMKNNKTMSEYIKKFKPDVIVLEISENMFFHFKGDSEFTLIDF